MRIDSALAFEPDLQAAWFHAVLKEIQSLIKNGTLELGQTPGMDGLIMSTKLVLKATQMLHGILEQTKARILAQGDIEKGRMKWAVRCIHKTLDKHPQQKAQGIKSRIQ